MHGTFKTLAQNQWEAVKSPFKMEFYTEPQSQCRNCDCGWFKTSERTYKVHSKSNSSLNCDLNVEPVTTTGSKLVRGREKSIQNGTLNRDLWLQLIWNQWEAVFDALLRSVSYCFIVIIVIIIRRHSWYFVSLIINCYHCCHYYYRLSFVILLL